MLCVPFYCWAQNVMVERQMTLMGSIFNISIVERDSLTANLRIDETVAEISRIENLISEWQPHTQISQVNQNAGIRPVKVDPEVFDLTKRAIYYSELSNGAFDITTAAMDKVWKFDGSMTEKPSEEAIRYSIRNVGFKNIILDSVHSTIYLKNKGMKIGFGSIGKGYAADRGRSVMKQKKVIAGMVNASGDLSTWGHPMNSEHWAIGIKNPFRKHKLAQILKLDHESVATSGNYEKFAEIDNVRYSHIINPKTGMPATGLTSVTVYGPSAEFCNALSTSIMVLGAKDGVILMKKYPAYQYLFMTDSGKIIKSSR